MDLETLADRLGCAGSCSCLSIAEARTLAEQGSVREVEEGGLLMREGDRGDEMQVLIDGAAEVWKTDPVKGEEIRLAEVAAGESVGEMAILRQDQRLATVRAIQPCTVFALPRDTFEQLIDEGDVAAYKLALRMARTMAGRLTRANDLLIDVMRQASRPSPEFDTLKDRILREWDY